MCGAAIVGLAGCAASKPHSNLSGQDIGSPTNTSRTFVPTYVYEVPPVTHDQFKVSLVGLEFVSTVAFKSQNQSRESMLGIRATTSLTINPIENSSCLAWRQSRLPKITEVIDGQGTNVLVNSKEDYNFRSKVFTLPRMNGIADRNESDLAYIRINAVLNQLPRTIKAIRGEAYVEVASSIVAKDATLIADPLELDIYEGVRAKVWQKTEKNQYDKLVNRISLTIHFSAERQKSGAIIQMIELSNAKSGRDSVKLTEGYNELSQTFENGELVIRGITDRLRAEDGPVSVRISVIPTIESVTIPFAFYNLPGSEP